MPIAVSGGKTFNKYLKWNIFVNGVATNTRIWGRLLLIRAAKVRPENTSLLRVASKQNISVNGVATSTRIWGRLLLIRAIKARQVNTNLTGVASKQSISVNGVVTNTRIWGRLLLIRAVKARQVNTNRWNRREPQGKMRLLKSSSLFFKNKDGEADSR